MTQSPTPDELRRLLEKAGLKLDGSAFAAALQGAQHLWSEIARFDAYLAEMEAKS